MKRQKHKDGVREIKKVTIENKIIIRICLLGLISFYVYHCLYWYGQAIDDAFITFRYSRNLLDGLGIVFNPGERVEGYSNFSWLLLITLGMKAGFTPIMTARFLGVLSGVGGILCSYSIYNQLSSRPQSFGSLLAPLLLATNTFYCYWSFTGMETSFFCFVMILAVCLFFKENGKGFPLSACFFGLLCLSRPEGVGYLGAFLAVEGLLQYKGRKSSDHSTRYMSRYTWSFYIIIFTFISGYLAFKMLYYGTIIPNPYYSKTKLPFQNLNIKYLTNFFIHHSVGLLLMSVVSVVACIRSCEKKTWFLISLLFFNYYFITYGTDWMPNYRFFVHTMPVFFTVIALGLQESIRQVRLKKPKYSGIAILAVLLLLGHHIMLNVAIDQETCYNMRFSHTKKRHRWLRMVPYIVEHGVRPDLVRETMFLIENTNENMSIGLRDIGFPAFITNCRVYDQEMLVIKGAESCYSAFKSNNDDVIKSYIAGKMYQDLLDFKLDFYLFPGSVNFFWGKWVKEIDSMYEGFFKTEMEPIARRGYGKETIVYYRRKGLKERLSLTDVICKYEEIVKKYPSYPAFRYRLNNLYKKLERLKNKETF